MPAEAGIQLFEDVLDPGFRRGDDPRGFLRNPQHSICLLFTTKDVTDMLQIRKKRKTRKG